MAVGSINLRIATPTEPVPPGRGFYQMEEDLLYVPIGVPTVDRRFFSYLECDAVRLETDRFGRLIFLEVSMPHRRWPVSPYWSLPDRAEAADIRFLDFRARVVEPSFTASEDRRALKLAFSSDPPANTYYLADSVFLQTTRADGLAAICVGDIEEDLAGRGIAAFRRQHRSDTSVPAARPAAILVDSR